MFRLIHRACAVLPNFGSHILTFSAAGQKKIAKSVFCRIRQFYPGKRCRIIELLCLIERRPSGGFHTGAYQPQHRQAFIGDILKFEQAVGKGIEKGDSKASRLPFADDCIAMADTPEGLQNHNVTAMRFIRK